MLIVESQCCSQAVFEHSMMVTVAVCLRCAADETHWRLLITGDLHLEISNNKAATLLVLYCMSTGRLFVDCNFVQTHLLYGKWQSP